MVAGMWRRRLTVAFAGVLLGAMATAAQAGVARAGQLAQVNHGLREAAGVSSSGGDNSSGSSSSGSSIWDVVGAILSGGSDSGSSSRKEESTLGYAYSFGYGPAGASGGVSTELYFGAQSVVNSDGATTIEARALYDDFGLGVRASSFYEQQQDMNHYLHLDVWWLGGFWRMDHADNFNVWLELGFTGLNDRAGLSMSGVSGGLHAARYLVGAFSAVGGARFSWFQHDVHAGELFAGLQVSIMQITYRIVDFDIGPPLYGPEVGVALTF